MNSKRIKGALVSLAACIIVLAAIAPSTGWATAAAAPHRAQAATYTMGFSSTMYTATLGDTFTLTAVTNHDVGPTPYWIIIYDTQTSSFLAQCPSGTSCSVTASADRIGTNTFIAAVARYNTVPYTTGALVSDWIMVNGLRPPPHCGKYYC
jgi:hypothetical protein